MTATVTVIGVDGRRLPEHALPTIASARLLVGRRTLLDTLAVSGGGGPREVELPGPRLPATVLDSVADSVAAAEPVVVLADGDPGFFGVLRQLRDRGLPTVSWPAVSCLQRVAAMVQRPWDDVTVVNARGTDFDAAVNVCRARRAVAVLTAPGTGPAELGAALEGWRRYLVVLEDYGGPAEKLSIVDTAEAAGREWQEPNIVLCLADGDSGGKDSWLAGGDLIPPAEGWALDEDRFAHREGVSIRPEVRALALAKLAPRPGTLVWDVFAGSGALGIEAARLGAAVMAMESDQGLCVRIVANASVHGVDVRLVDGDLPGVLTGMPRPDAIFVGTARSDVLRVCAGVGASRVVVVVHELEGLGPARDALADNGYRVEGCQLSAAPLEGLAGGGAAVGPATPTFLIWGIKQRLYLP
ncbi:MAG TPA: SAM-dependent methyltransferase [Actinophytocola sp.]|uniref:bifunctional cobalt-precorrin-7 (C(5))-methyltransferase/cobalt-precorrin-6B (C(15))-methyltransferase n=1 Tax=Actinophytocola sp. TaxID=1872138 RepID=UPI002DDD4FF7|nr:SAM-dependent methyltransferase [Actinophytocola sp.]HEV2783297.1 SAM-dependent methyltransferase [Actinophytocola sp.]